MIVQYKVLILDIIVRSRNHHTPSAMHLNYRAVDRIVVVVIVIVASTASTSTILVATSS